jgi:hypothetical protein
MDELILLFISVFAGFVGALLGLGGGLVVVPALTLFFHVHIRYAIAASLISVVATSSGAAIGYLKEGLTNLRLAVVLETGTVLGAIIGFLISSSIKSSFLYLFFGALLMLSALMMLKKREIQEVEVNHPWSESLQLSGVHLGVDENLKPYSVAQLPLGLFLMFGAGILSALLGIGSGIFKVLAMDTVMKLPIKVSSATSTFMIGVTAAGSAGAFFLRGDVRPEIAAPVAIGVLVGAFIGSKLMVKIPANRIRKFFVIVLIIVSLQMMSKGFSE